MGNIEIENGNQESHNTYLPLLQAQQKYFRQQCSKPLQSRKAVLQKFASLLKEKESDLFEAIHSDFHKSAFETYAAELGFLQHEIAFALKHLDTWAKPKRVAHGLINFPGRSYVLSQPLGSALIIGAWNYPYQVTLLPAISALAAGNTVLIKPSELAPATAAAMKQLINTNFPAELIHVVEGAATETQQLVDLPWNSIFFTGSTRVGREIYQRAAKNLTPVTLELGGKSPAFVLKDANLKDAAKKIAWAKCLNAGQTCVAPDFVWVEAEVRSAFIEELCQAFEAYPTAPDQANDHYVKIISKRHTERMASLLDPKQVVFGGQIDVDQRFVAPTLLYPVAWEDRVMQEEIFGPLLPIMEFENLEAALNQALQQPSPLACYVFSTDSRRIRQILDTLPFGGGCVNDCLMHLANPRLPFGGVGHSGSGRYHGEAGFRTFSHEKSIVEKFGWFDAPVRYPPYLPWKWKVLRRLLP